MSYTHFLYHIVFATKDRVPLISPEWEDELYRYIAGIIRNHKGEPIEINGMPDHTHVLVRLEPVEGVSDFLRELKSGSSKWIRRTYEPTFRWQRRYGGFTVSESASDAVRRYIRNQKQHHAKQTFEEEYYTLLKQRNVVFDERYLWDGVTNFIRLDHRSVRKHAAYSRSRCRMLRTLRTWSPSFYTFRLWLHV